MYLLPVKLLLFPVTSLLLFFIFLIGATSVPSDTTAANQVTLITVAAIGAFASITTAAITAYFSYLVYKVRKVTTATHAIVNHDRTIILEGNALTLKVAALDHPKDESLQIAANRAEKAAEDAREANAPADTKI